MELAAILALIGSVVTAAIGAYQSNKNIASQENINNQNIAYQEQANAQNIANSWKMFNTTNEYNTPAAQMERYKEAGLNPMLIYNQTNTASPVQIAQAGTPDLNSPKYDYSGLANSIDKLINVPFIKENYDITKEKARQEKIKTDIQSQLLRKLQFEDSSWQVQNMKNMEMLNRTTEWINDWFRSEIEKVKNPELKNKMMKAQAEWYDVQKKYKQAELKYFSGSDNNGEGMWYLQMERQKLLNAMLGIDVDWEKASKLTSVTSPWIKSSLSFVKSIFD